MRNCLFSSEIIYLTIPVQFKGCFGDAWMYIRHLRILTNSIYILVLVFALSDVFDYTKAHEQSWPELKLYALSFLFI